MLQSIFREISFFAGNNIHILIKSYYIYNYTYDIDLILYECQHIYINICNVFSVSIIDLDANSIL